MNHTDIEKGKNPSTDMSTTTSKQQQPSRFQDLEGKICQISRNGWSWLKENPKTVKRAIKCAVTLSAAIAVTITPPLVTFHGKNPFLLGTAAIYLFPTRSVGGQLVMTIIATIGFLLGLGYAQLILYLATFTQASIPPGMVSPSAITTARRAFLWTSFVIGAWVCGYVRSKHPRLYLSIVFFMIVNMFALIRGINNFSPVVFRDFFFVLIFGASVSMAVSLCLWPEDHCETLKGDAEAALAEARQVILDVEKSIWNKNLGGEVDIKGLAAAVKKLVTDFREADYELSLTRVDAKNLMPLTAKLESLLDLVRVYNCSIRARPLPGQFQAPMPNTVDEDDEDGEHQEGPPPPTPANPKDTSKRRAISFAFLEAVRVMDMITDRIQVAYTGKMGTTNIPAMELASFERNKDAVGTLLDQERQRRTEADVLDSGLGMEEVAFADLLNSIIVEFLDTVYAAAKASNRVTSTGKLRLFLPMKFRKRVNREEKPATAPTSRPTTPSNMFSPTTSEYNFVDDSVPDPRDAEDANDVATEIVILRPPSKWYTSWALNISRALASIKHSRHVKYGIKFAIVMGVLSSPAFVGGNYIWYEELRAQWALISAMVAMETTRGMTFRTAGMKVCGAVCGGVCAFIVMQIRGGVHFWVPIIAALFPFGIVIGYLVNNATMAKAGTVFALAFNIIVGVGETSINHNTAAALARRLITLPIGLLVAMIVHVGIFPYHARAQLSRAISMSMDWLHHLLYAIELAGEFAPYEGPFKVTPREFGDVINQTKRRIRYANSLVPATKYEISLAGHFPTDRFEGVLDRLGGVLLLIVGETGQLHTLSEGDSSPVLVDPTSKGLVEAWGRDQLLASLCNDLLVLSHTLSARLYMPRHHSHSAIVLTEYTSTLTNSLLNMGGLDASLADLGRLTTLVNEVNLLRDEIDSLIVQSRISPRAKEMFPEMVAAAVGSGCSSRSTIKSRYDADGGSQYGSRVGTGYMTPRSGTPAGWASPRSGTSLGLASPRSPVVGSVQWGELVSPVTSPTKMVRSRSRPGTARTARSRSRDKRYHPGGSNFV